MDESKKIIEIKNLTKIYKQPDMDIIIFENLNFEIIQGDFISIIGPSGSGKTTFLNLISTIDSSYNGYIYFKQKELKTMNEKCKTELRIKEIGFLFQFDSLLEDFNVIENIELPNFILSDRQNIKNSIEYLKRFSLEHLAYKMPQDLSGGEKQRISLLRAIRNNPSVILCDEPTGNLDYDNSMVVMEDLKKLNENGTTIIMVTHNIELAKKYTKKIYTVKNKKLKLL